LREYAAGGGEPALVGRMNSAVELSASKRVSWKYPRCIIKLFLVWFCDAESGKRREELLQSSAEFLAECLSPYEMAHRGFQDAVKALRQLNETLEEEIKRIAYAVHDEADNCSSPCTSRSPKWLWNCPSHSKRSSRGLKKC